MVGHNLLRKPKQRSAGWNLDTIWTGLNDRGPKVTFVAAKQQRSSRLEASDTAGWKPALRIRRAAPFDLDRYSFPEIPTLEAAPEIIDRLGDSFFELNPWFPTKNLLGPTDVRLPHLRVIEPAAACARSAILFL